MTGRLPRPQSLSPGLCVQPAPATHASHCAKVTSYLPAAKGCAKVTLRCGPSSGLRPRSLGGDPIMNSPAGTTTISGQSAQSRNASLAASPARLSFSWASATDSWNRIRCRKAIAIRNVGSTIFSTAFASILEGHEFGRMLVSTHAKSYEPEDVPLPERLHVLHFVLARSAHRDAHGPSPARRWR